MAVFLDTFSVFYSEYRYLRQDWLNKIIERKPITPHTIQLLVGET